MPYKTRERRRHFASFPAFEDGATFRTVTLEMGRIIALEAVGYPPGTKEHGGATGCLRVKFDDGEVRGYLCAERVAQEVVVAFRGLDIDLATEDLATEGQATAE